MASDKPAKRSHDDKRKLEISDAFKLIIVGRKLLGESFESLGREIGCSGNAIKKWVESYRAKGLEDQAREKASEYKLQNPGAKSSTWF